jgi:hypothetical protein
MLVLLAVRSLHQPHPAAFPRLISSRPRLASSPSQIVSEFFQRRRVFSDGGAELVLCLFTRVRCDEAGGALSASVPVELFNCDFKSCHGSTGGAVSTNASLGMHFVTIRGCDAREAGGAEMRSNKADSFFVHLCLFAGDRGDYFGALYRSAKGPMRITATNASRTIAEQCVGCLEMKGGAGVMRYVVVDLASAWSHNGGMCLREMDSAFVTNCLFARCKHKSADPEAAAALLVYQNPWDSELADCRFVRNHPDRSCTVTVASGHVLSVRGCAFTGDPEKELNPKSVQTSKC